MTILFLLAVVVFWRAEWTEIVPCQPTIDPWTQEPARRQPTAACTETRFKWLHKEFPTEWTARAFVETKPESGDVKVTNVRIEVYEDQPTRRKR